VSLALVSVTIDALDPERLLRFWGGLLERPVALDANGEAREADLGVASGNGKGQIFVKGEVIKTVPESQIVETLIEEAMRLAEEMEPVEGAAAEVTVS
jgi:hypothetical protein